MSWFVGELWKDLHPAPIGDIAPDAPGSRPAEDIAPVAPGDEPPAAEGEELEAAGRKDFEQQVNAAMQETLVALSGHAAFLSVTWDKTNGRFRILAEPRGSRAKYAPVKQYNKLVHGGSMDLVAVQEALRAAVTDAMVSSHSLDSLDDGSA